MTDTTGRLSPPSACGHGCGDCEDHGLYTDVELEVFRLRAENRRTREEAQRLLLRAETENRRLREALGYYGQHGASCMAGVYALRTDFTKPPQARGPCDCGFKEALEGGR